MQYLGIEYQMKHPPKLDPTFIPFGVWREAYLKDAKQPIAIAVERDRYAPQRLPDDQREKGLRGG